LISVKGNQEKLQEVVHETILEALEKDELKPSQTHTTKEKSHGRIEERIITVIEAPEEFAGKEEWKGIKSFVMAIRETTDKNGKTEVGIRYYISSLLPTARKMSQIVRGHWGIENGLHWVLDVAFGEDLNRARQNNAQANLGVLRRVALSMIKNTPDLKGSVKSKRQQAGWDEKILETILFGATI
jgi:predicted transposase YbfD/YdcC